MSQASWGLHRMRSGTPSGRPLGTLSATLKAAHGGPALAVTGLAAALAFGTGLGQGRGTIVVAAVLTSQLSIGWSNDLLDLDRDRTVGRTDKPLVGGEVRPGLIRALCAVALPATAVLGLAVRRGRRQSRISSTPRRAGPTTSALKATVWSWLPYAVAFGGLPAFVALAAQPAAWPPAWQVVAGALLGSRRALPQRGARPGGRRAHRRTRTSAAPGQRGEPGLRSRPPRTGDRGDLRGSAGHHGQWSGGGRRRRGPAAGRAPRQRAHPLPRSRRDRTRRRRAAGRALS